MLRIARIVSFSLCLQVLAGALASDIHAAELSTGAGRRLDELVSGGYSYILLERRNPNPDPSASQTIDGIVFFKGDDSYRFIRRLDEDYVLVLSSRGRRTRHAEPADKSRRHALARIISRNRLSAYTVNDKEGKELFVLFCGIRPCMRSWYYNKKGELVVMVQNPFKDRNALIHLDLSTRITLP